ncbi:MAG: polyprenyl synthetase family protein [Muribaculaceae bacterium]|nr:polyprenyl synthetase family protein [Muribaculaceae bacterium]
MAYSLDHFTGLIESALSDLRYPAEAPGLFDPVRYTLAGGGKRLRPSLLLATYQALAHDDCSKAINQALAIEVFHNFTLLHDDVMDNADLRRGRPTAHLKWGANAAIISGDAMLTFSTQLLAHCPADRLAPLLAMFNKTAMEVYEGQQLDMEFETRADVRINEYIRMIALKTSVLLGCACALGAIMAYASEADIKAMYDYGYTMGLAFQLRDDWLDTYGDPAVFGKEIGGDIINRKKTWLLITALEESDGELADTLNEDLENNELIEQVRRIYDRYNVGQRCNDLARHYSDQAIAHLENVEMDNDARNFFRDLAVKAYTRSH